MEQELPSGSVSVQGRFPRLTGGVVSVVGGRGRPQGVAVVPLVPVLRLRRGGGRGGRGRGAGLVHGRPGGGRAGAAGVVHLAGGRERGGLAF